MALLRRRRNCNKWVRDLEFAEQKREKKGCFSWCKIGVRLALLSRNCASSTPYQWPWRNPSSTRMQLRTSVSIQSERPPSFKAVHFGSNKCPGLGSTTRREMCSFFLIPVSFETCLPPPTGGQRWRARELPEWRRLPQATGGCRQRDGNFVCVACRRCYCCAGQ